MCLCPLLLSRFKLLEMASFGGYDDFHKAYHLECLCCIHFFLSAKWTEGVVVNDSLVTTALCESLAVASRSCELSQKK